MASSSGPYILQVVNQTVSGGTVDHYVPLPTAVNSPGKPGDYAVDPSTGRRVDYTGDGTNHSWGYHELVVYPPTMNQ